MRQRDNSLSMKSALRNPRTPGTAGRGGLKWSDNLEVRAATNVECVSETPKTETARQKPVAAAGLYIYFGLHPTSGAHI